MVDIGSVVCNVMGIRGVCCGRRVEFDCLLLVNMLVDMETWGCLVVVVLAVGKVLWDVLVVVVLAIGKVLWGVLVVVVVLAVGKVLWDVLVLVLISGCESRGCGVSLLQMGSKEIV